MAFAGSAGSVLMPAMARGVLMGGPATLGILTASSGVGAIAGALFLAFSRQRGSAYRPLMAGGGALFGAGLAAFSASRWLPLSCALLALAGFGIMIMMNLAHTPAARICPAPTSRVSGDEPRSRMSFDGQRTA